MRRIDSQWSFFATGFSILALAVLVLPACNSDGSSGSDSGTSDSPNPPVDSGDSANDSSFDSDSGFVFSPADCIKRTPDPVAAKSSSASCAGFEEVASLTIENGCDAALDFDNNFDPGEVIDSVPMNGTVAPGESVQLSIMANCADGDVDGFLLLDLVQEGQTSREAIPVQLDSADQLAGL